jgi:hypothetical protein
MLGRDTAIIKEGNVAHDGAREVGWRAGGPGEGQGQGDEEDVGSWVNIEVPSISVNLPFIENDTRNSSETKRYLRAADEVVLLS